MCGKLHLTISVHLPLHHKEIRPCLFLVRFSDVRCWRQRTAVAAYAYLPQQTISFPFSFHFSEPKLERQNGSIEFDDDKFYVNDVCPNMLRVWDADSIVNETQWAGSYITNRMFNSFVSYMAHCCPNLFSASSHSSSASFSPFAPLPFCCPPNQ